MTAIAVVYAGFAALVIGLVVLVRPLPRLRLAGRRHGLALAVGGLLTALTGLALPVSTSRSAVPRARIDDFMPVYQFHEYHSLQVHATPERIDRAIREVTASEIMFFRTLTWIRRFGRSGPESILNVPEKRPILDVASKTTFLPLVDDPLREVVLGTFVHAPSGFRRFLVRTPEAFRQLNDPGYAKAVINFRIDSGPGDVATLSTETRVHATDAQSARRFAAYWRVIYPGSSLIRIGWLRAIRKRAEAGVATADSAVAPRRQ